MHRCRGLTKSLRRCARQGEWHFFCADHARQPIVAGSFLLFTVIAGIASIYSAWIGTERSSIRRAEPALLDAAIDANLSRQVMSLLRLAQSADAKAYELDGKIRKRRSDSGSVVVIDFKFQNTGEVASFLRKVVLVVENAEIDRRPLLEFRAITDRERLTVLVRNRGWGPALCDGYASNATLKQLFQPANLHGRCMLASGMAKPFATLDVRGARDKSLLPERSTPLGEISFVGRCVGRTGTSADIKALVKPSVEGEVVSGDQLTVARRGFEISQPEVNYERAWAEPEFAAVLDADQAPYRREYSIARRIPPGDIDRFFIVAAATKSARFRLHLEFVADKQTILRSAPVEFNLVCPVGGGPPIMDGNFTQLHDGTWVLRGSWP